MSVLSTVAHHAGNTGSHSTGKDVKTWIATYNNREQWRQEWILMADVLVNEHLTEKYGVMGRKENRGWTLYLITYVD